MVARALFVIRNPHQECRILAKVAIVEDLRLGKQLSRLRRHHLEYSLAETQNLVANPLWPEWNVVLPEGNTKHRTRPVSPDSSDHQG